MSEQDRTRLSGDVICLATAQELGFPVGTPFPDLLNELSRRIQLVDTQARGALDEPELRALELITRGIIEVEASSQGTPGEPGSTCFVGPEPDYFLLDSAAAKLLLNCQEACEDEAERLYLLTPQAQAFGPHPPRKPRKVYTKAEFDEMTRPGVEIHWKEDF